MLEFHPSFNWHTFASTEIWWYNLPAVTAGTSAVVNVVSGAVGAAQPIASSFGTRHQVVPRTSTILQSKNPAIQTQVSTFHNIMANLLIHAVEAELRVKGDPSDWLCSPLSACGKTIGIVFINPYSLFQDDSVVSGVSCMGFK